MFIHTKITGNLNCFHSHSHAHSLSLSHTQSDYYGLLNIVHQLLHGEPLEVAVDEESGKLKPKKVFRRYWQVELWKRLFESLLNAKGSPSVLTVCCIIILMV